MPFLCLLGRHHYGWPYARRGRRWAICTVCLREREQPSLAPDDISVLTQADIDGWTPESARIITEDEARHLRKRTSRALQQAT